MEIFIVGTVCAIIGVILGINFERRSWEQQAEYLTPRHSGGNFYFVVTEKEQLERMIKCQHK